jgi:hypothetical protein
MKLVTMIVLFPLLLTAATREECAQRLKKFAPLEKAYDAVIQSGVASPASEKVIKDFRRVGGGIYADCKNKMNTTPWYMLGRKVQSRDVDLAKFHIQSVAELKRYAISHPPVITKVVCGTVSPGGGRVLEKP